MVEHGEVRRRSDCNRHCSFIAFRFSVHACAHHSTYKYRCDTVCFNPNPLSIVHVLLSTDYSAHSSASLTGSQLPLASFTGSQLPPLASQTTLVTSLAGV